MLSETRCRLPRGQGLHVLQRRGERGARLLTTRRLVLDAGESIRFLSPDEETIAVLQDGSGTFTVPEQSWAVSRGSVFTQPATALWLPPNVDLQVDALTRLEAVFVSTPAPAGGSPVLHGPGDIQVNQRGRDAYVREVHDIFVRDAHVRKLMVGETFNPPGMWSSYPPHKHDGRDGEPVLEEVYYYRVDPPQGFGQQMQYTADGESVTHDVRDGDLVLIPYGYHPVSAAPGYRLYYLWAIAGDERKLAVYEDPAHRWVAQA
jgi:5-deoxy-glucuronate isomerase